MDTSLFHTLFRDKPALILIALLNAKQGSHATELAKKVDCTYPHIVKILAGFKQQLLIEVSSSGRVKPIALTFKGRKIAALVNNLYIQLRED